MTSSKNYDMKILCVTGCLGFIPSYFVLKCLKRGWMVYGIDKITYAANESFLNQLKKYENFKFLKADIKDLNSLLDCDYVVNYVVNAYNVDDIEKVDKLRVDNNLGMLRLNIAQIWDAETKMSDDIATSGYTEEDLNYLRENWNKQIMGKSKWDFEDCFWVNNGIYTTVEGHVKMCCMNTGAEPFGNLFLNTIDEIREMEDYQNVKKGCNSNNPTSHCKNCSYKELTPILEYVGI